MLISPEYPELSTRLSARVRERVLEPIRSIVGPKGVITDWSDMQGYREAWRDTYASYPAMVVQPSTTEQTQRVVRICADSGVPIVAQGGNTGVTGAGLADASGGEVLLSLRRMNRIRSVEAYNDTMVVEAGCILDDAKEAAREAGRFFPLSIGSQGSCTIGGNIATNAGGLNALRYGSMRNLVAGLEVVLADGTLWNGLSGLRKDNAG